MNINDFSSLTHLGQLKTCNSRDIQSSRLGVGFPPIHTSKERQGWQNYVRELVRHFKDRVTHYEVWNEPDLLSFWECQPKAEQYVDLVRLTTEPLRQEYPDATIIGGAIAWGMTVWSLKYLDDCMKTGLHELIDIVSYHGYKSVPERHSSQEIAAFKHILNKYKPSLQFWQVYSVEFEMDKRTCAETWMEPDQEAEGVRHFPSLPVSNEPVLLTDRSVVEVVE